MSGGRQSGGGGGGGGERKRPNVFGDDSEQAVQGGPKKLKGNSQGTPSFLPDPITFAPLPNLPPPPPPPGGGAPPALDIAAIRANIQAKLALMKKAAPLPSTAPPPPPPSSSRSLPPVPGLPTPNLDPDLAKKVADAKRLVESMQARKLAMSRPANPYLSASAPKKNDPIMDPAIAARGGLSMAAHPLLMDTSVPAAQTKKERYKPMVPKFSTTKANARLPPQPPRPVVAAPTDEPDSLQDTPFFDPRLSYGSAKLTGKNHMGRGHARDVLKFNQKGKFVRLGEAIRAEAKMEELKKRILESARKAGLESEMEDQAKVIKRPAPPEVEWWDTPFLSDPTSYSSFSPDFLETSGAITIYVQHPIQIPAPQDKIVIAPKDLFLTKKEMKKMRRQRRLADMQDKQDRVKMGLLPPPPPKVKLSNMMNVLTQDAIADPTKVEAKVRREMAARENGHLRMNAERKLTDDQRREKVSNEHLKDESKGIQAACFKVRYLSNPSHKFKVKLNAQQQHLTGVLIFNPKFCLVLVEGGAKAVKFYKRLMLTRIDWTSEALPRDGADGEADKEASSSTPDAAGEGGAMDMDSLAEPESLADNKCSLVWEGVHREKMFSYFKLHNCPSDANAREVLGPKLEGLWDVAKVDGRDEDE
ncbi:hypothetical protein RQP46_006829 [Phenoliferia psychrophenolica]